LRMLPGFSILLFGATLELRGSESSINFAQTGAQLTAKCPACTSPSPPAELKPHIMRMAPTSFFFPLSSSASVKLRLKDIVLSCADAPWNVPCVLPFDDVDQPSFYCNWHKVKATDSTILTGPVAASVSSLDKASVNLTAIHESPPTCATTSCAVAQPRLVPTVDCPVPDVTKLLSGDGTIYLTLTYAAPVSSSLYAIPIPFVGNGPNAVSFTSAPPSPPANPPNPPPPSPSPPPPSPVTPPPPAHAVAWYKVTTGSTENDGNDKKNSNDARQNEVFEELELQQL